MYGVRRSDRRPQWVQVGGEMGGCADFATEAFGPQAAMGPCMYGEGWGKCGFRHRGVRAAGRNGSMYGGDGGCADFATEAFGPQAAIGPCMGEMGDVRISPRRRSDRRPQWVEWGGDVRTSPTKARTAGRSAWAWGPGVVGPPPPLRRVTPRAANSRDKRP